MQSFLAVVLGSGIGGGLRYLVVLACQGRAPWGVALSTFLVNTLGSFAFCALMARQQRAPADVRLYLGLTTGVLGGFTTYSTFNGELIRHLLAGRPGQALLYLALTVLGCLAGGALGWSWVLSRG